MTLKVEAHFHLAEHLGRLGWEPILRLPKLVYPNLVREFHANMVEKEKYSGILLCYM